MGGGGLMAQTEKGRLALGQDWVANPQGCGNDGRADCIWQRVAKQDTPWRQPESRRRFDEWPRANAEHLAANQSRDAHTCRRNQHDPYGRRPRPPERRAYEQEHQSRHREKYVGQGHQQAIDDAARPGSNRAGNRSDDRGQQRSEHADAQRDPSCQHHSREQVAAKPISPEKMKMAASVAGSRRQYLPPDDVANRQWIRGENWDDERGRRQQDERPEGGSFDV